MGSEFASDKRDRRRFKLCVGGLVWFILLLAYPFGVGPWICYSHHLPSPVKQFGDEYYYAPIGAALASESFENSTIGKIYIEYLMWWIEIVSK